MGDYGLVLVLDDDPVSRRVTEAALGRSGYRVAPYSDGQAVLDALGSLQKSVPDLFLTDVQMPGLDGLEVYSSFRERFPTVPVLFFTACSSDAFTLPVGDPNVAMLRKPSRPSSLIHAVDSLLARTASVLEHPEPSQRDLLPPGTRSLLDLDAELPDPVECCCETAADAAGEEVEVERLRDESPRKPHEG